MKPLAIKRKSLSPGQPRPHTLTQTLFPASQQNACLPITELRGPSFRPGSQDDQPARNTLIQRFRHASKNLN